MQLDATGKAICMGCDLPPVEATSIAPIANAAPTPPPASAGSGLGLIVGGCLMFAGLSVALIVICGMLGWILLDSTPPKQAAKTPPATSPMESPETPFPEESPTPEPIIPIRPTPAPTVPRRPTVVAPNKLSGEPEPSLTFPKKQPLSLEPSGELLPLPIPPKPSGENPALGLRYQWDLGQSYVCEFSSVETASVGSRLVIEGVNTFTPTDSPIKIAESVCGAAVVVHPHGVLITSAHLLNHAVDVQVFLNGESYTAEVLEIVPEWDVALLKIAASDLAYLPLHEAPPNHDPQKVWTAGYPTPNLSKQPATLRPARIGSWLVNGNDHRMYIDEPSSKLLVSAGPVVDAYGRMVGFGNHLLSVRGAPSSHLATSARCLIELLEQRRIPVGRKNAIEELRLPKLSQHVLPTVAEVVVTTHAEGRDFSGQQYIAFESEVSVSGSSPRRVKSHHIVTDQGHIVSSGPMRRTVFRFGDVSLMGLESLPFAKVKTWQSTSSISVSFTSVATGPATRTLPGLITNTYRLISETAEVATIEKHYQLTMPYERKHEAPFLHVEASGLLTWSKALGMPLSLTMEGETTTHFPGSDRFTTQSLQLKYTMSIDKPASASSAVDSSSSQ